MDQEDGDSQERSPLPDADMEGVADDEDVGQSRKRTRLDDDEDDDEAGEKGGSSPRSQSGGEVIDEEEEDEMEAATEEDEDEEPTGDKHQQEGVEEDDKTNKDKDYEDGEAEEKGGSRRSQSDGEVIEEEMESAEEEEEEAEEESTDEEEEDEDEDEVLVGASSYPSAREWSRELARAFDERGHGASGIEEGLGAALASLQNPRPDDPDPEEEASSLRFQRECLEEMLRAADLAGLGQAANALDEDEFDVQEAAEYLSGMVDPNNRYSKLSIGQYCCDMLLMMKVRHPKSLCNDNVASIP